MAGYTRQSSLNNGDTITALLFNNEYNQLLAAFNNRSYLYPYNTPTTKEAYYYRTIFHKYYPQSSAAETVRKWIPKWQENQDPSGRANAAHVKADTDIAKTNVII